MPRRETARLAWEAGKQMDRYLRQRAWDWTFRKNFTLASDYAIRLLNRHPSDPLGLLLGEIAGERAGQGDFAGKCIDARRRLCRRKNVDDVLTLLPSGGSPAVEEIHALLRDLEEEKMEENPTKDPSTTVSRSERLMVRETATFAEVAADVRRCCRRLTSSSSPAKGEADVRKATDMNGVNEIERLEKTDETRVELMEPKGGGVFGRGLYAARRLSSREVLLADDAAFAFALDEGRCAHCLSPLPPIPIVCPHCREASERHERNHPNGQKSVAEEFPKRGAERYCGKGCQEAAWAQYHACCCPSVNPGFARWQQAMTEVLYGENEMERRNGNGEKNLIEGLDTRAALSCLSVAKLCAMATMQQLHPLALLVLRGLRGVVEYEPATALSEIGALAIAFSEFFRQPNLFMEEILSILALLQTNEFFLPDRGGIALYPTLSLLNHSCDPNCAVIPGNGPLQRRLISLRDIRDGEQLLIDYNAHLTSKLDYEHRKALCAQRHFECFCVKCIRRI